MGLDPLSVSAIIISVIGAIGVFVAKTHLQHCLFCKCIESDCRNNNQLDQTENIPPFVSVSPMGTPQTTKKMSEV
jgi:hypothetical protein